LTGPRLSIVSLVSGVNGVEARTQTSPEASLIAVVRPPIGRKPKRKNGLRQLRHDTQGSIAYGGILCLLGKRPDTFGDLEACMVTNGVEQAGNMSTHLTSDNLSVILGRHGGKSHLQEPWETEAYIGPVWMTYALTNGSQLVLHVQHDKEASLT
jgi:hypothetical protein